jgi:prepilin-type N-terminal cleavage/methylation domain-containing protein
VTRRGFTLVELVIGIALVLVLVATSSSFFFELLGAREQITRINRRQVAVNTLIERVERDLMTSLVGDPQVGAGVRGDEAQITILARAVPAGLAERGTEAQVVFADLERAEYRFGAGRLRGRRAVLGDARRAPQPADLGADVGRVRFRFHDGDRWRSSFDSLREDRLPHAVEIAVWFEPWPGEDTGTDPAPDEQDGETPDPGLEEADPEADVQLDDEPVLALDDREGPAPDRVRVIVVPDADASGETDGDVAGEGA